MINKNDSSCSATFTYVCVKELCHSAVFSHRLAVLPSWFFVSLNHKPTKPVFKSCHTLYGLKPLLLSSL
ncbi:hypothetical protein INR49_022960 [Caranx melampygus]|nr:hypothetical protein INR49_022960 [Caranx melampygus]